MKDNYLIERTKRQQEANLKSANDVIKDMQAAYDEVEQRLNDEIVRILGTYIAENGLTMDEARRYLTAASRQQWKKTIKQYMEEIKAVGIDSVEGQALWLELSSLAAQSRINRLEALKAVVDANVAKLTCIAEKNITEHLETVFKDDYYENMYFFYSLGAEKAVDMARSYAVGLSNSFVHEIVTNGWVGSDFINRLWRSEYNNAFKLTDLLVRSLLAGESAQSIAKDISKRIGADKKDLYSLVITETAHVKMEADLKSFTDSGVERVKYKATLDTKTCEVCRPLDGKIFPMDKIVQGVNKPPMHPRCRCNLLPYDEWLENMKDETDTRAARDADGKTIYVPSSMTYYEWERKYILKEK